MNVRLLMACFAAFAVLAMQPNGFDDASAYFLNAFGLIVSGQNKLSVLAR